jgi:hypothetical protein
VVGVVLRVMLGAVRAGLQRREATSTGVAESSNRGDVRPAPNSYVAGQDHPGT